MSAAVGSRSRNRVDSRNSAAASGNRRISSATSVPRGSITLETSSSVAGASDSSISLLIVSANGVLPVPALSMPR